MLTITPITDHPDIFNLPVFQTVKIGTAVSDTGLQFSIYAGLDQKMAKQLIAYSIDKSDAEIQQTTRDPQRFGIDGYEKWYGKSRYPYVLIAEPEQKLAAIVWYGPKEYPLPERTDMVGKNTHTAVYRSYIPYRGKGLMTDFSRFTQELYLEHFSDCILWLETASIKGIGLYRKLGFKETGEVSPLGKTVMVLEK